DGEIGFSIEDGKKVMATLQSAVVKHEAETYALFRRVCPDCHTFRPVKDYTTRRIRTVFGAVAVRNPRWMLCPGCHPGLVGAFYRQAASILAQFLPIEPTETHATVRKRTIRIGERLDDQMVQEIGDRGLKRMTGVSLRCSFLAIAARSLSSASTRLMFAAPSPIQRVTSSSSWPDAAAADRANPAGAISSPAAPTSMQSTIVPFTPLRKLDIAASAM
ncbi:hypothetical protein ACWGTI_32545, partial [Mesorhizobium sp. ArgA1]